MPGEDAGEWHAGRRAPRRGTRSSPPDVGRGLPSSEGAGGRPPSTNPLEGAGSHRGEGRVERGTQPRGGEGRADGGAGALSLGGSRRPWGRAPGARACGGCTSGIPGRRAGGGGRSCRLREGAPRLRGETGWSEVPGAAWEGSAEGSAGSPGASPGGGGGRVSAGTRLLLRQLSRRSEGGGWAGSGCARGSVSSPSDPAPASARGGSQPAPLSVPKGTAGSREGRALREPGARGPAPPCGLGAHCRAVGGGARGPSPGRRAGGGPGSGSRGKVTARQFPVNVSCAAGSSR